MKGETVMKSRLDYIKDLKESKTKAITITIEEGLISGIEDISEEIGVSRNQIISQALKKFTEDFEKVSNPSYYILKTNSKNVDEAVHPYLNMLRGNKACAWDVDRYIINDLEVGDYIFILDQELGIVGAGTVISEPNYNSQSYIDIFEVSEEGATNLVRAYDEIYVNVDYDLKADCEIEVAGEKILSFNIFKEEMMKTLEEDTARARAIIRRLKEIEEFIDEEENTLLCMSPYLGKFLKKMYIENKDQE